MPEFRRDLVRGDWVIIATERAKRPEDFTKDKKTETKDEKEKCIFCEGHENETPPEVLAFGSEGRAANTPGWKVRVFPNKFPAVEPGNNFQLQREGIYEKAKAIGFHEIIVTLDHDKPPALMSAKELELMLRAYQERFSTHCGKDFIKYVLLIYNHGEDAGASLKHPHSQLFAIPIVSGELQRELKSSREYYEKHKKCIFCSIIENEVGPAKGKRVIYENEGFIAFAPYASKNPFETWILPRKHNPFFQILNYEERLQLAECLRVVLKKLYKGLDNPAFNYYIQSAPCDGGDYQYYHWQLEILPRLTKRAGFELGTGAIVNVVDPDEAARFLRGVKVD